MKKIAGDIFQIAVMPRSSINCYWLEGFLIDAGIKSSSDLILEALSGKGTHTHVLTHAHADHQGSSKIICEELSIPLWCSALEKPQAESGDATKEYPNQDHIITKFQKRFWAGEGMQVSKILCEGDSVGRFKVIETPGHSSGHLSFFREEDGVLIVGDVCTNMNLLTTIPGLHQPPGLFTLDKEKNIQSIKKIASLNPQILCFGHGPVLLNKNRQLESFAKKL